MPDAFVVRLHEQRREYQIHNAHELDKDVQSRAGGILERIAHGVADNGGLVSLAALAAMGAALDVLLGEMCIRVSCNFLPS